MTSAPSRVVAIVNPATKGNVHRMTELLRIATPSSTRLDIFITEFAGHAGDLARAYADDCDLLVAIGGDGTVAEVAGAARASGVPIGVIPGGSTNIIARELRIPTNSNQAAQLLFGDHAIRTIDAGIADDRIFLHMAGAGVDSLLFDLANPALKKKMGWMAYIPAAVEALRKPLSTYAIRSRECSIDSVRSPMVLVANGSSIIAPGIQIDRRIQFDDGKLDVLVVTATRPLDLARVLGRMAMRQMGSSPFVTWFTTEEVEISADPEIAVQFDGDVVSSTPVRFTIVPSAVRIVVPRETGG